MNATRFCKNLPQTSVQTNKDKLMTGIQRLDGIVTLTE